VLVYIWQKLKIHKEQLTLILESAGEGIYGLDLQGKIIFVNNAASKMLGYSFEELKSQHFHSLIHYHYEDGSVYPLKKCPVYNTLKKGKSSLVSTEVYWRKDGSSIPVEYHSMPIKNNHGQIKGAVITFQDITERKKNQLTLQERNKELARANKDLQSFSYSVSHDLRAPLRHITGFIQLLKKEEENHLRKKGKHYLSVIDNAAQKMGNLIDELLKFSRAGRFALEKKNISLNELVNEILTELSSEMEDRDIQVEYKNLPEVFADENMLRLVFYNLISNAIKFSKPRKKALIHIKSKQDPKNHIISVADNGVGFEQKYAKQIFGVFQRLHTSSEFEGTGIGLANVAKIINRHGGEVWARSKIDKGTIITFTIPKK